MSKPANRERDGISDFARSPGGKAGRPTKKADFIEAAKGFFGHSGGGGPE